MHRRLNRLEYAVKIDCKHLLPKFFRYILDRAHRVAFARWRQEPGPGGDAGIGEDHVEAALSVHDPGKQAAQRRTVGEIGNLAADLTAASRQLSDRAFGVIAGTIEMTTRAPLSLMARAIAKPSPFAPPVTATTLSATL
jgi:hypothetical protein